MRDGHVVRTLRALDLPLGEIKQILEHDDDAFTRGRLIAHRERLLANADLLRKQLATLNDFIEKGVSVTSAQADRIVMINISVNDTPGVTAVLRRAAQRRVRRRAPRGRATASQRHLRRMEHAELVPALALAGYRSCR